MKWLARPVAAALWLTASLARAAAPGPAGHAHDLAERVDRLVRAGGDAPQPALASLDALPAPTDAAGRRTLALARAEILARSGNDRDGDAAAAMGEAVLTAAALTPALAEADGHYLRALQAERDGHSQLPALAGGALTRYDAYCAALASPATAPPCEYRTRWRLHQLLGAQALSRQQPEVAHRHAQDALSLAQAAGDIRRQAGSECLLAQRAAAVQEPGALHQHLDRAAALARRIADPALQVQVTLTEATTLPSPVDPVRLRALLTQALAGAQRAGATRLEAGAWANLSDLALREHRADDALRAAGRGLALSRPLGAHRITRVLEANTLLAQVYLGRAPAARQALERLMAAWAAAGDSRAQLAMLRHFGDALAATGDWAGALAMHHRERALGRELHAAAREATLAELRGRYDREAQQRSIVMQARDNAVKAAALQNRALTQWLWTLGGGVLALALLLVGLLAGRARATNRALARSQRQLRQQSEHDALTGLLNRRHLQARLQSRRGDEQFQGALLLLDIDHFKQVNDRHGHAAGDAVLVTLARRLSAALPDGALAARWGGEEFLIALPGDVTPGAARALARQLLQAVAAQPVPLPDGPALAITTSIGHARFPLPQTGQAGGALPLGLTRAIHLVDMALYLAKTQGRHRAVGVTATAAPDIEALRLQEADLERAAREGRVRLDTDLGPEPPARPPAAALPPPAHTVPA